MDDRTPPAWMGTRVARPGDDLERSAAFYRDLLGLEPRGRFLDHDGWDGVFFALPDGGELEVTNGPGPGADEHLLVLYLRTSDEVAALGRWLTAAGVPTIEAANPYWHRHGQTFLDPDGNQVVVATLDRAAPVPLEIDWHAGSREPLRPLFEHADDSADQLDRYLHLGRVLVARRGMAVVGHLQLVETERTGEIELRNMAVIPDERGTGVGRALVASAVLRCRAEGRTRMVVGTGAADVGNLRFYQRVGFRLTSVEWDAFTPATGYPEPIIIDGIQLRDRVWLACDLQ